MLTPAPKISFDLNEFKAFAAKQTGEYDYQDIDACAIGQYITSKLGEYHSRYFVRVDPAGKVYLRSLTDVDDSYDVSYPRQLDEIVRNATEIVEVDGKDDMLINTWEQLNHTLSQIDEETFV